MPRSSAGKREFSKTACVCKWHQGWDGWWVDTFQVGTLLLSEPRARLLHPRGEGHLYVLGHDLLGPRQGARDLLLTYHALDPLNTPMAVVETLGDVLRQALDVSLFFLLGVLIVEAWEHVLLVQALEFLRLPRHVSQDVGHFVRDVRPARRQ